MGVSSPVASRFALDVKGLDGLKRAATKNPQAQLKQVATQFEALFLSHMLKSMRAAGVKSQLLNNQRTDFYKSLLDQQLAQQLAGKGLGQAQMLVRQLSAHAGAGAAPASASATAMASRMHDALPPPSLPPPSRAADGASAAAAGGLGRAAPARVSAAAAFDVTSGHDGVAGRFVQRFADAARTAAKRAGVPALLILAQAALESGWGLHEASAEDGTGSHNLFGIKAGAAWKGAAVGAATDEYVDGHRTSTHADFRAYGSYADAFLDHARLIGHSARYAAVRAAKTPQQAAQALQDCGYATDPRYADKLIAVMKQIGHVMGM